jgi:glycosyltransferase involved in cell wall biosynthesis
MNMKLPKVAFFSTMGWGGTEKVVVNLLNELVKYPISLQLVVPKKQEKFLHLYDIPPEVSIVELPSNAGAYRLKMVFPLIQYLQREKPSILVSNLTQYNVIAPIAKLVTGFPRRLILVEHLGFKSLEEPLKNDPKEKVGLVRFLRRLFYNNADVVAGVSQSLAQEIESELKWHPGRVKVLYNPVIDDKVRLKAQEPLEHPWFQPGQPPVFLGVGRFVPQKDFPTLIQAFALLRQRHAARLVILGEGSEEARKSLEDLIAQLNLKDDILLPGFTDNPYAYMSRSTAFVLSSEFEGLPTVIIEALACGCQVVSTDCPHGPNEILKSGEYGRLVPVGNCQALADAMEKATKDVVDPDKLRLRAEEFSLEKATSKYLELMKIK